MKIVDLCGRWAVYGSDSRTGEHLSFDGQVPSSALNDLISSKVIPESVFWRDNADSVQKYENFDWVYTREFSISEAEKHSILHFERLDTYCDVYLNSRLIASTDDGFIPYDFDVSDALIVGTNRLEVRLYSPITRVAGKPKLPGAFTTERLHTRRVQFSYGWDWAQRFVTCGIGACSLICEDGTIYPKSAYVYTKQIDSDGAAIGIEAEFANETAGMIFDFVILSPDGQELRRIRKFCNEPLCRLSVDIEKPELWFPVGYGSQPLYTLRIEQDGQSVHEQNFGIRTVRILQLPDEKGSANDAKCRSIKNHDYDRNESFSGFILKVNGVRILCMGANWVPCEPFEGDATKKHEKITATLELAKHAGVNMLRVWGGGAFECEHFYDECARLGIMVTQDFLMACGHYPEKEVWFIDRLHTEAEYAARLLRGKACLMWWSGDNENAIMGSDTDRDYSGRSSAYQGIAPVLYRLAPHTEFLPSSPYGGSFYASNTVGTTHNTQYLGEIFAYIAKGSVADYRDRWKGFCARFIAEEPAMGAVCRTTLDQMMTPDDIVGDDLSMWAYHTKSNPALTTSLFDYTLIFAEKLFGNFRDGDDRYFKLKYLQYEWIRLTMEQARREKWFCSGIIYWMLNDCWPAASGWALIDYALTPKASYYAFSRCAKPLVLSLDYADGKLNAYVSSNRTAVTRDAQLRLCELNLTDHTVREILAKPLTLPENDAVQAASIRYEPREGYVVIGELTDTVQSDRTFYQPGTLTLSPCTVESSYEYATGCITLSAAAYVHTIELEGIGSGALFDDNYFSLMPNETRKIHVLGVKPESVRVTAYTLGQ